MIINGIKLNVGESQDDLRKIAEKKSGIKNAEYFKILKKSIDARDKSSIKYVYNVEIGDKPGEMEKIQLPKAVEDKRIVVVGFGPSGIFCALYLARAGYKPIVVERGKSVDERSKAVELFAATGELDENTNVQFGEGGAGTFSDGKLNTGVSSPLNKSVLRDFVSFGAPSEIEYESKPHIGSDRLPTVVKNARLEIERLGGSVFFGKKLDDFSVYDGKIKSVTVNGEEFGADDVVLAIGHSARDTFYTLLGKKVAVEPKAFAMGFRIEHSRRDIDEAQYGEKFARLLPAADYRLASHKAERGTFTFCMCPGGYVMPSASEFGGVVTNGMSLYGRDGDNSNSAILCEIYPSDFHDGILGGVELQRAIEREAFELGGRDYSAPVQTLGDFYDGVKSSSLGKVKPTYPGYRLADLNGLYPEVVTNCIKTGMADMNNKLRGFASRDAVLTGAETRSSSPIRILRGEDYSSVGIENLYPCGEGCGYAGGIMSAAVDGIRVARAICEKYAKRA